MFDDVLPTTWSRIAIVGSLVTAVGSIPTWFTLTIQPELAALLNEPETITRGGLGGDGSLTLVLAALVAVAVLIVSYRSPSGAGRKTAALATLGGIGAAFLAFLAWADFQDLQDTLAEFASGNAIEASVAEAMTAEMHVALSVVALGSLLLIGAGILGLVRASGPSQTGSL